MKNVIMITILIFMGTACAGIPTIPEPPKALVEYDPPKWVLLGGGAWSDSKGKAFYGVGSATGIKNYSLQRTIADDRARGDLGKVFEVYMTSLTKDYQAHTTMGGFGASNEEQNAEVALQVVVHQTLRGVVIVDHFEIPARQEFLSLARLDYDAFKRNVENNKEFQQLPRKIRDDIKERADKLHEEMQDEANRLNQNRGFFAEDE
ncbi:MAG: hypothetical protein CL464_11085 [Acidimicrobiaceae bacterium]|nr:hypothetical protein [Acidimicrobiaceae bacterium]|tara:strand:- start:943 stop:1557 length:615 start_codon:yes stop_codon:yes gene_type:complete